MRASSSSIIDPTGESMAKASTACSDFDQALQPSRDSMTLHRHALSIVDTKHEAFLQPVLHPAKIDLQGTIRQMPTQPAQASTVSRTMGFLHRLVASTVSNVDTAVLHTHVDPKTSTACPGRPSDRYDNVLPAQTHNECCRYQAWGLLASAYSSLRPVTQEVRKLNFHSNVIPVLQQAFSLK